MKKKYQIFISSTFIDLVEERQWAVQAILKLGHIPAGMELFAASDVDQWNDITKWIDESDIYMLILGGRYGSIDPITKKSYTQKEYEYAISKEKPCFAIILSEAALQDKASKNKDFIENTAEYKSFKDLVKTRMIEEIHSKESTMLATVFAIGKLEDSRADRLIGWVKANSIESSKNHLDTIDKITSINSDLFAENSKLKHSVENLQKLLEAEKTKSKNPQDEVFTKIARILSSKITEYKDLPNENLLIHLINNVRVFTGPVMNPDYAMFEDGKPDIQERYRVACEYFTLGLMDKSKDGIGLSLNKKGTDFLTFAQD